VSRSCLAKNLDNPEAMDISISIVTRKLRDAYRK